jgi:hypothetical protein
LEKALDFLQVTSFRVTFVHETRIVFVKRIPKFGNNRY